MRIAILSQKASLYSTSRLKEAAKLGFTSAWTPPRRKSGGRKKAGLEVREIAHLQDLVRLFTEARGPRLAAARGPESG